MRRPLLTAEAARPKAAVLMIGPFTPQLASLADMVIQMRSVLVWRSTCREAIECISERHVDMVLAAPVLPDGEWTAMLRTIERRHHPPPVVVIATARSTTPR